MNHDQSNLGQKPFILIVDDVQKNLQVLGNILSSKGYLFTPATSGKHALAVIKKRQPDLILLDIMMPELDGYEVCRILKSSPTTKHIPIIFLTAKTETEDIVKGFELGCVDYVSKPFNTTELIARIRTHLEILKVSNDRRELIHVLCHDLSNAFSPILSSLPLIKSYEEYEQFKDYIFASASNGMKIIEFVRKIRSLEDNKTTLSLEYVNLKRTVDESLFILKNKFLEKRIEIIKDIDCEMEVYAEKTSLLNSVINNIFTNAIKFSFPGSKIIVKALQKDDMITISIIDFGVGMSENLKKDLFEMKKPTTRKGTAGETGTGFGMPIVRKFVHAYGGTIRVFSKEKSEESKEHGSEIRVILQARV